MMDRPVQPVSSETEPGPVGDAGALPGEAAETEGNPEPATRFRRGLVVGKFCPLHLGHESIIRRVIEQCDDVVILSYTNPEFADCPPEERKKWLAARFPGVTSLVASNGVDGIVVPLNGGDPAIHRRFCGWLCREKLGVTVDAVFTSEDYGDGFAEELTRYFREFDPDHPVVAHVLVDRQRRTWPVSGTMLRDDVHGLRQWLSPEVYSSFVQRICLVGGESSGKSTLAAALAEHYGTRYVTEYGRELWESRDGKLEYDDMLFIARKQLALEDEAALKAHRYLFCDTSPLTTLFYSEALFQMADPHLGDLAARRYDLYVLCAPDFPFVQDGTRQDEAFRRRQHDWYLERLSAMGQPWIEVTGSIDDRLLQVEAALAESCDLPI